MQGFVDVINQLIVLFKELVPLEEKKREAARSNDIPFIEDCMVKEQSAILKLKGLEQERERLLKNMGMGGLSFREILETYPEHSDTLRPLFTELGSQIQMFKEISEGADVIIKTNLNQIENAIKIKEGGIYSEAGETVVQERHFTNRKV